MCAEVDWLVLCARLSGGVYLCQQCGYFGGDVLAFGAGYDTRVVRESQFRVVETDVEILVPDPDFRDCRDFQSDGG